MPQQAHPFMGCSDPLILKINTPLPQKPQLLMQVREVRSRWVGEAFQLADGFFNSLGFLLELPDLSQDMLLFEGWNCDTAPAGGCPLGQHLTISASTAFGVLFLITVFLRHPQLLAVALAYLPISFDCSVSTIRW
jgi:hypothetical protein